nr:MAG TPA: hypothetical protein [Caudoviricetes sp.]
MIHWFPIFLPGSLPARSIFRTLDTSRPTFWAYSVTDRYSISIVLLLPNVVCSYADFNYGVYHNDKPHSTNNTHIYLLIKRLTDRQQFDIMGIPYRGFPLYGGWV